MFSLVFNGSPFSRVSRSSRDLITGGSSSTHSPVETPQRELAPEWDRNWDPLAFPRRVLLVEPSRTERRRLRNELIAAQLEVHEVEDLITAMETAPISRPNLILAQMRQPGASGLELIRRVKEDRTTHSIPVMLYSKFATEAERVRAFELGAADLLAHPFAEAELIARIRAVLKGRHRLTFLEQLAHRDALTGLANRGVFEDQLAREWDVSHRHQSPLTVMIADLDHFKVINDTHGHAAGDEVLRKAARILAHSVRASDLVARYGGEEFVVIAPDCPLEAAISLASRFRAVLNAEDVLPDDTPIPVTASVGIAVAHDTVDSPKELLRRADLALYQAKRSGRDAIWIYDPSQNAPRVAVATEASREVSATTR